MNPNIILESGKEYSLSQLFSGDNKIIIPDLQRDYCWGDKAWNKEKNNYTELVSNFTKNLLDSYIDKPKDNLTLGLIYGYENPKNHIQLSDGQQRITTLFLLLGMLNRRVENKFQKHLISDYELKEDDKEPYLLYAIRESTLYFLGDLVNNFFLKNGIQKVEDIKKQDWYFKEYDLDSSIQSMISAIKTIDNLLEEREKNLSHEDFGKFILEKLKMIYYDMGNRTRGEETFVIINTTGEPLTATENLKPILIGNIQGEDERKTASNEWEEREEWFWQNRSKNEATSDSALNDFFIWYWQIRLLQEKSWKNKKSYSLNPRELFLKKPKTHNENEENPQIERWQKSIKTETIHSYFIALQELIKLNKDEKNIKVLNSIKDGKVSLDWFRKADLDVVLPLIAYLEKFKDPKCFYEFIRRIRKNAFDNKWKERKDNYIDWRHLINIIDVSDNEEDVFKYEINSNVENFIKVSNVALNEWYNEEEKIKDELKISNKDKIEEWEDHEDFRGDLKPLFEIARNSLEFNILETYFNTYIKIRIKDYRFSDNIYMQNIYRLYSYLEYGKFEHRGVGGYGYCMLIEYDGKDFLKPEFSEIWRKFNQNNKDEIVEFFKNKLIDYFQNNIFKSVSLDVKLEDFNSFGHYEKVRLWALLEFLCNKNKYLNFSNSISCFWENKQNLKNKDDDNLDYQTGNLLLGTSYFNNKTGWVHYDKYPLMKSIKDDDTFNVPEQTKKYNEIIRNFL
jgi:hypothetical protein